MEVERGARMKSKMKWGYKLDRKRVLAALPILGGPNPDRGFDQESHVVHKSVDVRKDCG